MPSAIARPLVVVSVVIIAATRVAVSGSVQPTFRSGLDLVPVDFLALAKDGSAVRDLRAEDVTLRVDGRVRPIRSLEFVELARSRDEGIVAAAPLPPPYGSNRLADAGRAVVLVLDRDSIHPGQEEPIR